MDQGFIGRECVGSEVNGSATREMQPVGQSLFRDLQPVMLLLKLVID